MAGWDLSKIKAALDAIPAGYSGRVARFGWFPSATYEDGTQAAYVAAIQEYGAPEVGIPPRPFVKPTIDAKKAEWVAILADGVRSTGEGKTSADKVLDAIGRKGANDIQTFIATGQFQPLSPVTLMLRKWRLQGKAVTGKTVGEAAAAVAAGESVQGVSSKPLVEPSYPGNLGDGYMVASCSNDVSDA